MVKRLNFIISTSCTHVHLRSGHTRRCDNAVKLKKKCEQQNFTTRKIIDGLRKFCCMLTSIIWFTVHCVIAATLSHHVVCLALGRLLICTVDGSLSNI